MSHDFVLFAGRANPALATAIARDLGVEPGACTIEQFPDGEIGVQLGASVRGKTVFLLQPTSPPVNDHLVELLVLADACRRAAAALIIAIVPYFGYARSDKRQGRRTSITARAVAELLETLGITHVVTVDVHAAQMEGFFHIPIDNLTAVPLLCAALHHQIPADAVVVAPDLGAVRLATDYSARLGVPTVICHKQRVSGTQVKVARLVGDVRERTCIIIDDMITTGGTIAECARALREAGARDDLFVAATHGVLVPGARERLAACGVRDIVVTDTVAAHDTEVLPVHIVSVAPLLADAVRHLAAGESLYDLYARPRMPADVIGGSVGTRGAATMRGTG